MFEQRLCFEVLRELNLTDHDCTLLTVDLVAESIVLQLRSTDPVALTVSFNRVLCEQGLWVPPFEMLPTCIVTGAPTAPAPVAPTIETGLNNTTTGPPEPSGSSDSDALDAVSETILLVIIAVIMVLLLAGTVWVTRARHQSTSGANLAISPGSPVGSPSAMQDESGFDFVVDRLMAAPSRAIPVHRATWLTTPLDQGASYGASPTTERNPGYSDSISIQVPSYLSQA